MKLIELIAQVHINVNEVDFGEEIAKFDIGSEHQAYLQSDQKPYRYRAALVKTLGAKAVLELGTKTGSGALALAKYADRVVTCDISMANIHDQRIFDHKIEGLELSSPEQCLTIAYDDYDFILVDIDHQGEMESRIHQVLQKSHRGVVMFDDIEFNDPMRMFWEKIENEKAPTSWHPPHGAGLVLY